MKENNYAHMRLNAFSQSLKEYDQFPRYLHTIYKSLSIKAKYLYMLLYNRWRLSIQKGFKDDNGDICIIYAREEMEEDLGLSDKPVLRLVNELKKAGLLEEVRLGHGHKNRLYLYEPVYEEDSHE